MLFIIITYKIIKANFNIITLVITQLLNITKIINPIYILQIPIHHYIIQKTLIQIFVNFLINIFLQLKNNIKNI